MTIVACSVEDCDRKALSRGWCDKHYRRWLRHGDPNLVKPGNGWDEKANLAPSPEYECAVDGCRKKKSSRGWCAKHYKRWKRWGDPLGKRPDRDDGAPCSVKGCAETVRLVGYCYGHYARYKRHGDPLAGRSRVVRAIDHSDGTRTCNTCDERREITDFYVDRDSRRGRTHTCKYCFADYRMSIADRIKENNSRYYEENRAKCIENSSKQSQVRRARLARVRVEKGVTRDALRRRDGDNCHFCRRVMDFSVVEGYQFHGLQATLEHLIPISRGGDHSFNNCVLACRKCNVTKNSKLPEEFMPGYAHEGNRQLELFSL